MAISVLDNPVLFGMRLGAELDQLRQGAMAQAITQSLREALDLHTWRYGMLANLLAAYHRAQSPEEKGAYAQFIDALVKTATYPHQGTPVVPGVAISIPYLWREFSVGGLPSDAEQQSSPQPQEQQGDAVQSNQQQPVGQQTTAPQAATTAQPAETRKLTEEELQAIRDIALSIVDPWYALVRNRLQSTAPQTMTPEQQAEGAVQPMQQQPAWQQGTEQLIREEQSLSAPAQQTQGGLGEILQQQPTTPPQPSQQQPGEYKPVEQAMQIPDWGSVHQTAVDQVLHIVFPWYSLVKNDPRWRQALSGIMQRDLEREIQRQQRSP